MSSLRKLSQQLLTSNYTWAGACQIKYECTQATENIPNKITSKDHTPVMAKEVVSLLKPESGKTYIDMTFGAGGHSSALLEASPDITIIGLDRDPVAKKYVASVQQNYEGANIKFQQGLFTDLIKLLTEGSHKPSNMADGIVFDLGASTMQYNDRRRGFSLKSKGPLDMRMSGHSNLKASAVLNQLEVKDLRKILKIYGQEKKARQIAESIVNHRQILGPISTTRELQDLVSDVYRKEDIALPVDSLGRQRHPATLTFQALRIFVNDELNQLYNGLKVAHLLLKPNAVCAVISYHSLEHNIVHQVFNRSTAINKETLVTQDLTNLLFPWKCKNAVIKPSAEEVSENPKARSAELRFAYKKAVLY